MMGRSSMLAVKQFTLAVSGYRNKKAPVLEVNKRGSITIDEKAKITEWMRIQGNFLKNG